MAQVRAWALEAVPRATRDRVHLTKEGYLQLGGAFAAALLRAYDAWSRAGAALGESVSSSVVPDAAR